MCIYLRKNPMLTNAVLTYVEYWGLEIIITKFNFKSMIKFKNLKTVKVLSFDTDLNQRRYVKL